MSERVVAILAGDGIGPEIMRQGVRVLNAVVELEGQEPFVLREGLIGGAAFAEHREHFPSQTQALCDSAQAILFGAVGGPVAAASEPQWKGCEVNSILAIRKRYGLQVNLRPTAIYPELAQLSPLRKERIGTGVDLLIVRELIGDIYFGEHRTWSEGGVRMATDRAEYSEEQIAVAAHAAFKAARGRKRRVSSVDKANVLDTSKLWRGVVSEIATEYPDVNLEHVLVDNAAMQLTLNPAQFDVLLTSNLFGDILSDLAAALAGSLGLAPSASLNRDGFGLYEPISGSAQDIAGRGIANPIGQILSVAMMLRHSFGLDRAAGRVEAAVRKALAAGVRSADIVSGAERSVSTVEMTDVILKNL